MSDPVTAQVAREELYDIVRGEGTFESKARQALDVGTRFLDADIGYLARVDTDAEYWEVVVSTEPVGTESPLGTGIDFETSYCRRTVDAERQVALHNVPAQGWADDPAFEAQGLHCYHGTTLIVDGEPYGTVCFVADAPRGEFSECECLFAELIARLLERELERQQHETELTRQANLATVLNRVLRHNLRNKLSIVRGYTQLLADSVPDSAVGETALDTVDSLIELSEKARKLDRIVGAESDPEPTDLSALVDGVADTVACQYPEATVAVDCGEPVSSRALPSLERALMELIENAAKHGGEAPTVSVGVETDSDGIEIRITDDGPGIAAHEVSVLESGAETPLIHGSGLGLWLAHWIVTGHGGTIEATVSEQGTTMTVRLPHTIDQPTTSGEGKLSRTHGQYQAAFKEATDGMVIADDDGRIVEANPAAATMFGLDSQRLLGRPLTEFLPAGFDFEAAWDRFQTLDSEHDTVTIAGADGVDRTIEYTGTTNIVPGHHLIVGRDASEHPETENRLSS